MILRAQILKALHAYASPTVNIYDLKNDWDIYDDQFIAAFNWLLKKGYIADYDNNNGGLFIGADGNVSWHTTAVYITDYGNNLIQSR